MSQSVARNVVYMGTSRPVSWSLCRYIGSLRRQLSTAIDARKTTVRRTLNANEPNFGTRSDGDSETALFDFVSYGKALDPTGER